MKRTVVGIFIFVVMMLSICTTLIPSSILEGLIVLNKSVALSYTPHAPIYIYGDGDFENQGWPGAGTLGSPYIISGFNFTYDVNCILIEDTTAHFVIEDCFIGNGINTGITLYNVTNGIVRDTVIGKKTYAIYLDGSVDCQVTNVTFIDSGYKVYLYYCENIHVDHCTFEGISGQGLWIDQDTGSIIEYNNLSYQEIFIWDSTSTNISHNIIYNNDIELKNCDGLVLLNNSVDFNYSPCFNITSNSQNCLLENNRVHNPFDSAFNLDNVSNITLRNNNVTKDEFSAGEEPAFNVIDCNDCTLERNYVSLIDTGFAVLSSVDVWLHNNTAYLCSDEGIYVAESEYVNASFNTVFSNTVFSGTIGIQLWQTNHCIIANNNVSVQEIGIKVSETNCTIVDDNVVYDNEIFGILITGSDHPVVSFNEVFSNLGSGIRLTTCQTSLVSDNALYDNSGSQIDIGSSNGSYLYHNTVSYATGNGIELQSSSNCSLIMNTAHNIWGTGIYIHNLDNFTMIKNTAYDNLHSGLYLRWVDASYVESMTAYNHQDYGIRVELCIGITLHQCIAYNNGVDDLLLQDSETCSITSTSLGDRGLRVVGDIPLEWEHTVTSTTVNDGPVVYLFDAYIEVHDAATYGQLFIVNSSIIFINNGEFSNHSSGVVVAYSDYCVFSNVAAHNCGNGFEVIASPFCTFDHCTAFHNYWNGFELEGSSDNYFTSCIMYDQLVGIAAETSPYLTINNCDSFNNAGSGFEIIESDFLAVVNSTSYSNFNDGVSIVFSKNCTIADNYIHHSGYGVRLINCINATIDTNNIELFGGMVGLLIWESIDSYLISNNVSDAVYAGINLKESSGIYVDSNKMSECGLLVEGEDLAYWNHEIGSNTVNEKPLGVFTGIDSYTTIDANDFGQLYVNNSIHVEIYGTSFANVSAPLIIVQCENITISEVSTTNGVYGVMVVQSNSCILRNFVIETPRIAGVYLYCATNMKLDDIVVSSTIDGFLIRDSDNSSFTNCIASNASQHGFYILNSDDCIFDSNVAYYNVNGFYLWYSLRNNFTKNGVFANENGFYIRGLSDSNLFLQNEIGWNTFHNAIDDVVGNTWDNGFDTGNAWSDYVSGGYYNIYGAAGAIDGFPAKLEQLITMIEGSDDIIFWRGVSSDFIQWNVTSKYPSHYVVLINGSVYLSGVWDGITPIIIELDELTVGVYNFTLFVYSLGGHHDSDSVSVTVLDQGPTSPTTQEPTTSPSPGPEGALGPMIILGAVIVLLLVALFVRRRR